MKHSFGLSLIIACLGLSLAAPLNTMEVHHVENIEELPTEIDLGTIVFKPKPGLFHEFASGVESEIHSEEPVAVVGAGEFLVAGAEIVNPPKNNPQPRDM